MNHSLRQVSGVDASGAPILSVLAKRSYRFDDAGVGEAEESRLIEEVVCADGLPELVVDDTDLYAFKPLTDVVVRGTAYPPRVCQQFNVRVQVGSIEKRVVVLGRRRVLATGAFSDAESAAPATLSYAEAFGGADANYLSGQGHPFAPIRSELAERPELMASNPFAYPRNPCGQGFRMEDSGEGDELPLFEDPDDRLTPERRRAGRSFDWTSMPSPAGLGWLGILWFPRCVFFGIVPAVPSARSAPEVASGWVDGEILSRGAHFRAQDPRHACGASPGLSVPHLNGGERIRLENLSPGARKVELELPRPPRQMRIDGRGGRLVDVSPVLNTVLIEPESSRITVVWRGSGAALRPYDDEELERMPFEVKW